MKIPEAAATYISTRRVARLATAAADGRPHVVPICYAFDGASVYTALDLKPKRVEPLQLKRVRNILANPRVALVVDDYTEEWSELAHVLVDGLGAVVTDETELRRAVELLREKYPQYETLLDDSPTVLRITPERVVTWGLPGSEL